MDVGIVTLELGEEFIGGRESAIWLADAWDSVDDEFVEPVVPDEVEEASWEFTE
jgi:hypothetical protein